MQRSAITASLVSVAVAVGVMPAAGEVAAGPEGHFIRYQGQLRVLVGDSGTQCVLQNPNIDYPRWIDDSARAGLNSVHLWAFVAPRQTRSGRQVEPRYGYVYPGLTPWPRRSHGPNASDGWPQWDLTEFDEGTDPNKHYWPRLADLCRTARNAEITVGISVFFGWPKHNSPQRPDWLYHPFNRVNGGHLTEHRPMVEVVQRIATPGREILDRPWEDLSTAEEKTQWIWERFAQKPIDQTRPFGNTFFIFMDERSYSEGNCGDHFAKFFRRRGAFWIDGQLRREMIDGVLGRHGPGRDLNAEARESFDRRPSRPFFELESPPYTGDQVRHNLYACLLGGGHYFFHNDERQETTTTGIMGYDPHVRGARMDLVDKRRKWLGIAAKLLNRQVSQLDGMRPQNKVVTQAAGHCLARPGEEYVVYIQRGGQARLDLGCPARQFDVRLIDPRSGNTLKAAPLIEGHEIRLGLPDDADWLIHLAKNPAGKAKDDSR